jgi:tetratricopeptide (TPR) repeat protein
MNRSTILAHEFMKSNAKATIALMVFFLTCYPLFAQVAEAQSAQPSPLLPPQPVPPLSDKQKAAVQQLIQQGIEADQGLDDRIEEKVRDTFGWTITLINFLITVLIAFPIVLTIAAWALRRSIIAELLNETKKQFREETEQNVKQQLEQQIAAELQEQVEAFRQELENQKTSLTNQLQVEFVTTQQEKEQILNELSKIASAVLPEEPIAPEVQKRIRDLTEQLERLKAANPQLYLNVEDHIRLGDALTLEQRYDDALVSYEQALVVQPDRPTAWLGKSRVLQQLERYEEAGVASDRAIRIAPTQFLAWYSKAQVLLQLQRYPEALKTFNKAIRLNPEQGEVWRWRGYVLTKLGRYTEATVCFEKATKLQSNLGGTHYGLAYYFMAQGQVDQALIQLRRAIDLQPQFRRTLQTDPDFDLLREDDRFKELIQGVPIPE